uniref:Ig-like domain-containing protein n=1 Tax=Syphacia muris TaxID=451379 RepID=A0A0N5B1D0_9BILA
IKNSVNSQTSSESYQKIKKDEEDGTTWWRKCCSKGIYLTDVCVPGRCSNSTAQLCCAQKLLQARYRCCNNETQDVNRPTDSFSRCCYENFVDSNDLCCPHSEARNYWMSNAELCLPNVSVNLTDVVLKARISDNEEVVVRLSEDRSWDYKCTYGTNVMQFIYLPGPATD